MLKQVVGKLLGFSISKQKNAFIVNVILVLILSAFCLQDVFVSGWQMRELPNLNTKLISGVEFIDTLTGFVITNNYTSYDSCYILKTTDGGANWSFKLRYKGGLSKIHFVDNLTGFVCGGTNSGTAKLFKTTDSGNNWFLTYCPATDFFTDMSFVNKDTFLLADNDALIGGLYRSTNGGQNWQNLFYQFNYNPDHIYMVNRNLGFMSCYTKYTARTTDGGINWTMTQDDSAFSYIHFADSLNGWKTYVNVEKTTDGGLTWIYQNFPSVPGAGYNVKGIAGIASFNKDTVFAVGGYVTYGTGLAKGLIYKTTNGGINWGYQLLDTSYGVLGLQYIDFVTAKKGWAFSKGLPSVIPHRFVYTNSGGDDTTYYVGIEQHNQLIADNYSLEQNYPNPFNQSTVINYQIKTAQSVKLILYDITGKQIRKLINERKSPGQYSVLFDAGGLSSGIYFYTLILGGNEKTFIAAETRKMLLVK